MRYDDYPIHWTDLFKQEGNNMALAEVIKFERNDLSDIPGMLRKLAEAIEAGEYDEAYNLVWVLDCGAGRLEVGLLGHAPEVAPTAHFLLALAQQKLL